MTPAMKPDDKHPMSGLPRPNRRWDIFLSHASDDVEIARKVCDALEASGWSVFLAARDLPGEIESADWSQRIDEALDGAGALVLLASPEALTKRWVTYEWRSFHDDILSDRGGWIVPCCVRGIAPDELGRALRRYQIVDLRTEKDWDAGFSALRSLIEGYLRRPIGQTPNLITRRVLTIEGAGVRTIVALAILDRLEAALGGRLVDHFDLIVGNSISAVVAARLAQGASVAECERDATMVFERAIKRRSPLLGLAAGSLLANVSLRGALKDVFGDGPLTSAPTCAISTYDLVAGEHRLWSAHPNLGGGDDDPPLADVIEGSIASPFYFLPVTITRPLGGTASLVDGGVWTPDPMRLGLDAIRKMFVPTPLVGDIVLVSVGCGQPSSTPSETGRPTANQWITLLPSILRSSYRASIHEQVSGLYRDVGALENYLRLDPALPSDQEWPMDKVDELPRMAAFAREWAQSRTELIEQAADALTGRTQPARGPLR